MKQVSASENRKLPMLHVMWYFLKPYKLKVLLLLVLSLLVGGLEAAIVVAVYPILNAALNMETTHIGVIGVFQDIAGMLPAEDKFVSFCILFVIVAILTFLVRLIYINFRMKFSAGIVKKNQRIIYNRLVTSDYQYFIDHKQGEIIYNVSTAPTQLSALILSATELLSQIILSFSVMLLLFSLSWPGMLIVLTIVLIYYFSTRFLANRISYPAGLGEREAVSEGTIILNESITGIKQIKVFATADDWINRFYRTVERRWFYFVKRNIWQQVPPPALMALLYISIGLISVMIKITTPESFTSIIPLFGTFAFAVFRLSPIMSSIGAMTMQMMSSLPDCEAVYRIQHEDNGLIKDGEQEFTSFGSSIEFDNVTFMHKRRSRTLSNVSVSFQKGKTTAIVGRSGAGKTTIINLILRLFDPSEGEIRIDGVNLKEYKLTSWLNKVGFVSQDTFILNDTITNNITFCADRYTQEKMIKAANFADAHSFITKLPDGYSTFLGDKGMRLSGGQAQRIAVARAMIRDPEIMIFDEATNNLDNISELALQRAIEEIAKDHTVIIIAHRLSTIAGADIIIVLDDGRVIEQGAHQELLDKRGAYWRLYQKLTV